MRRIIDPATHERLGHGPFQLSRMRPGLGISPNDNGFGPLGLIDRAQLSSGLVVKMHEHRDDEIVSYLRSGALTHTDSDGNSETIGRDRLMVMNAGAGFSHEERMPEGEDIHMLQIFVRPRSAGLDPLVQFAPLDDSARTGAWRAIVAPDTDPETAPATVRQDLRIFDTRLGKGAQMAVPDRAGHDQWLYVFSGAVTLEDGTTLTQGAAVATTADARVTSVTATEAADLVLFEMRADAIFTRAGSLSGGR